MVRINLVNPRALADQHLVAEYNEILMLLGHAAKHPVPRRVPPSFTLGKGHISFFKDKIGYLERRHRLVSAEMRRRGFSPTRTIDLGSFPDDMRGDFSPRAEDVEAIIERLHEKVLAKPGFYRYEGVHRDAEFFLSLLRKESLLPVSAPNFSQEQF